jgi:hypothetical protein
MREGVWRDKFHAVNLRLDICHSNFQSIELECTTGGVDAESINTRKSRNPGE